MAKKNRAFDQRHYATWRDPNELTPYEKNAKIHDEKQIRNLVTSLKRFGWQQDCVITSDDVLVIGHGRRLAAMRIGCDVPVHVINKTAEELTDEDIRELRIADNQTNAETGYDFAMLANDMDGLEFEGFDFDFHVPEMADWFGREEKDGDKRQEGNDAYNAFLDKFEEPKTTDDCYTPDNVYDAVADWVANEYGLSRGNFVRPFYPGGDYQAFEYAKSSVVVDNPPFSILSEIIRWYCDHGVRFFLFAPTLSLFTAVGADVEYMPCGVPILYENGATVNTSFINNIGENRIHVSAELFAAVDAANEINEEAAHKDLPKYNYPDEVVLAARVYTLARYGQTLKVPKTDCIYQNRLDAQKEQGKDAYGGLFLLSEKKAAERAAAERAAAEKAAATKWKLSDREREIVRSLGKTET